MAKFHKGLTRREDVVVKRGITSSDIAFLQDLQKELNTQDTVSQANPRFWVIRGTKSTIVENEYCSYDRLTVETLDDGEIIATDFNGFAKWLESTQDYIRVVSLYETRPDNIYVETIDYDDTVRNHYSINSVIEWLDEYQPTLHDSLKVTYYEDNPIIYSNLMFLTEADAAEHLRQNHYHYSDDAHTYAMTAWRSPRVETLITMLSEIDFSKRYIDADLLLKQINERYLSKKDNVPNTLAEGFMQMETLIKEQIPLDMRY